VDRKPENAKEMAQVKTAQRLRSANFCLVFILVLLTSTVSYGACFDDALAEVRGNILVMDSGAVYRVTNTKGVEITFWLPPAEVTICDQVSITGEIYYSISNKDVNETVWAARERRGRVEGTGIRIDEGFTGVRILAPPHEKISVKAHHRARVIESEMSTD
jgi:hypothetical protein